MFLAFRVNFFLDSAFVPPGFSTIRALHIEPAMADYRMPFRVNIGIFHIFPRPSFNLVFMGTFRRIATVTLTIIKIMRFFYFLILLSLFSFCPNVATEIAMISRHSIAFFNMRLSILDLIFGFPDPIIIGLQPAFMGTNVFIAAAVAYTVRKTMIFFDRRDEILLL